MGQDQRRGKTASILFAKKANDITGKTNQETRKDGVLRMTSPRAKGLLFVREVKDILKRLGHEVEGPGHKVMRLPSGFVPVHSDFFGVFDLISFHPDHGFRFHQVSTDAHRSTKVKEIAKKKMNGTVWGRCKMQGKIAYRSYYVAVDGHTEELETYYLK